MKDKRTLSGHSSLGHSFPLSKSSLDDFRRAASTFTKEATSSKEQALKVLRKEGVLNAKGKLTKRYS